MVLTGHVLQNLPINCYCWLYDSHIYIYLHTTYLVNHLMSVLLQSQYHAHSQYVSEWLPINFCSSSLWGCICCHYGMWIVMYFQLVDLYASCYPVCTTDLEINFHAYFTVRCSCLLPSKQALIKYMWSRLNIVVRKCIWLSTFTD
jgi:hypothetical protein